MSNRKELWKYREAARLAAQTLEWVQALPRNIGSLVQWGEPGGSGIIWRREGDDIWVPLHKSDGYVWQPMYGKYPSSHVAMAWQGWAQLKRLPTLPA